MLMIFAGRYIRASSALYVFLVGLNKHDHNCFIGARAGNLNIEPSWILVSFLPISLLAFIQVSIVRRTTTCVVWVWGFARGRVKHRKLTLQISIWIAVLHAFVPRFGRVDKDANC